MYKKNFLIPLAILMAFLSLAFVYFQERKESEQQESEKVIRLGYIIYEPLLSKDLSTGELSGISYDIAEAVAGKINREIEWTEEVGWGTALEGLKTNRYDVLGTQMWSNKEREKVASFSIAPMQSVMYPYVKFDDQRFDGKNIKQVFNQENIIVSGMDGEMALFIAQEDYPKAKVIALPQLSSYAEMFLNILQGKADVTFTEPSSVAKFLEVHPQSIKRVGDVPLRSFANSFAFKKGDTELMNQWNQAIEDLIASGEIRSILQKYNAEDHYIIEE